jgi:hypothetical protein
MIVIRMPIELAISWGVTGRKEAAASPPISALAGMRIRQARASADCGLTGQHPYATATNAGSS